MRLLALMTAFLFFVACGKDDHDHDHENGREDDHHHEARHGGDMVELGDHEGFMEVKIDHDAGTLTIWLSGEDGALAADKAPVLSFVADGKPVQVEGKGSGDKWVFTHAGLKGEPEKVKFSVTASGKTFRPKFDHHH